MYMKSGILVVEYEHSTFSYSLSTIYLAPGILRFLD